MRDFLSDRLIFVLSLFGLVVATFLLYEYNFSPTVVCPIGGSGCDVVRASVYSKFLGTSIPIWGVAFYLGMAFSAILRSGNLGNKLLRYGQLVGALGGFGFGAYLTYLEAFVIHAYCFWCVISFIISAFILGLVLLAAESIR